MTKDNFVEDSEYMETLLIAVPKYVTACFGCYVADDFHRNLVKEWKSKYERLASMVVPRSSSYVLITVLRFCQSECGSHRSLASDEDYTLFSAVIFRRVHDEFVNKCRENKFIVRDFVFSEESIHTQREELEAAFVTEKELWVSLSQFWLLRTTDDRLRRNYFV